MISGSFGAKKAQGTTRLEWATELLSCRMTAFPHQAAAWLSSSVPSKGCLRYPGDATTTVTKVTQAGLNFAETQLLVA
jgi:hypothetical protein